MHTHPVWVPHLLCSTPGYSPRLLKGDSIRGNALWALQGKQGTSGGGGGREGVGLGQDQADGAPPPPQLPEPLSVVCWRWPDAIWGHVRCRWRGRGGLSRGRNSPTNTPIGT